MQCHAPAILLDWERLAYRNVMQVTGNQKLRTYCFSQFSSFVLIDFICSYQGTDFLEGRSKLDIANSRFQTFPLSAYWSHEAKTVFCNLKPLLAYAVLLIWRTIFQHSSSWNAGDSEPSKYETKGLYQYSPSSTLGPNLWAQTDFYSRSISQAATKCSGLVLFLWLSMAWWCTNFKFKNQTFNN